MYIDPQIVPILEFINSSPSKPDATVQDRRTSYSALLQMFGDGPNMESVEDRKITSESGSLGARIYRPTPEESLPVLVYYHGGGCTIGDLDAYNELCRQVAHRVGCVVVSVDYRLAPENRFPAAVEDSLVALEWVLENALSFGGDPSRVGVGGDSAGGNLATVTAINIRHREDLELRFQLLLYPSADLHLSESGSVLDNSEGFILTSTLMRWFTDCYCPDAEDRDNYRASPIRCENLSGLPPTFLATASLDPLLDQGESYADALEAAGNKVTRVQANGLPHLFLHFHGQVEQSEQILATMCEQMSVAFV